MSNLSTLLNKVNNNFQQYSKTKKIEFLLDNIKQFEAISRQERLSTLKKANNIELANCNDVLCLIAETYIAYAFANQSNLSDKDADQNIVKALTCYKEIKKYIGALPPSSLSNDLLLQNTKAVFFEAKTKFQQAQIRLLYTLNKMKNSSDTDQISLTLDLITQKFNTFKDLLEDYKSGVYQQMTEINQLYWVKTVTEELSKVDRARQSLQDHSAQLLDIAKQSLPNPSEKTKESHPRKKTKTLDPIEVSMELAENPNKQEMVDTSNRNENNSLEALTILSFFASQEFSKSQSSQEPAFPFKDPEL